MDTPVSRELLVSLFASSQLTEMFYHWEKKLGSGLLQNEVTLKYKKSETESSLLSFDEDPLTLQLE